MWTNRKTLVLFALAAVVLPGCSETVRTGRASSYLIIDRLTAADTADEESDELSSDVQTHGGRVEDIGLATFRLAMKDVGTPDNPAAPTVNNHITVNRYRVSYRRTDGRNTPGVDVPYAFEGAGTVTVSNTASLAFVLVRVQAKGEPPLKQLAAGGGAQVISTIADVTFYGRDQTGSETTVTGSISVNFADWADPPGGSE
jgi:hypothetical protein